MDAPKTLEEVESLIKKAKGDKDLFESFGVDAKKAYHIMARICHPDRNPGEKKAADLFKQVQDIYDSLFDAPVTIKSKKRVYTLFKILNVGDVADIHLAQSTGPDKDDTDLHDYLLKISRVVGGDVFLENERKILGELLTKAGDSTYRMYFPTLVESFPAQDAKTKVQKRVNVFTYEPKNFYTVEELHEKLPEIGSRHLAWMFKRILTAIGFAHTNGFVHGAVLPPHIRIQAENHGAQLTSWGHAVPIGKVMKTVPAKYKNWYPPEVLNKKPARPSTDIYLAAKTMLYLAGANPHAPSVNIDARHVPIPMQRFFQSCLLPGANMREDDAWKLHDEFDKLLKTLYGKPKFFKLEVPN